MPMNQIGMNQMQMNPIGINNQLNQFNQLDMDNTTMNIRNIVQPYEKKIKELEEIIRQKDFEITVLNQKLNNLNSNINSINNINLMNMNINPMMPNINIPIPQIPQMPLQQIENKDNELNLKIISGNDEFMIKCLKSDKIKIIREKCHIKEGLLIYNYIVLYEELTFKDYEEYGIMKSPIIIAESVSVQNIVFKVASGLILGMPLNNDCPINIALMNYIIINENPFELFKIFNGQINIRFNYNGNLLSIKDKTPIKFIFNGNSNPNVLVTRCNFSN